MKKLMLLLTLLLSVGAMPQQVIKVTEPRYPILIRNAEGQEVTFGELFEGLAVSIQDSESPPMLVKFNQIQESTQLSDSTVLEQDYIIVDDTTGVRSTNYIIVYDSLINRVYFGSAVNISIDTVFLDTPIDAYYHGGASVDFSTTNFAVDGSTQSQIFGLRGQTQEDIDVVFDVTRIIFKCFTDSPINLDKFGDLNRLTKGLVLRKRGQGLRFRNIFNVKDNGELAGIMLDFNDFKATNPAQGTDGFIARLTFSGQEKMGVVLRLRAGEDLEFLIQDNFLGITLLEVVAEGHEAVVPEDD